MTERRASAAPVHRVLVGLFHPRADLDPRVAVVCELFYSALERICAFVRPGCEPGRGECAEQHKEHESFVVLHSESDEHKADQERNRSGCAERSVREVASIGRLRVCELGRTDLVHPVALEATLAHGTDIGRAGADVADEGEAIVLVGDSLDGRQLLG